jgi:hypothetical protein
LEQSIKDSIFLPACRESGKEIYSCSPIWYGHYGMQERSRNGISKNAGLLKIKTQNIHNKSYKLRQQRRPDVSTWVFNAAYFRLRNITLGYTIPEKWLTDFFVKGIRIYCSGLNLLTFDKLPAGVDPLVPNGSSGGIFPVTSNFSIGIDVNFK